MLDPFLPSDRSSSPDFRALDRLSFILDRSLLSVSRSRDLLVPLDDSAAGESSLLLDFSGDSRLFLLTSGDLSRLRVFSGDLPFFFASSGDSFLLRDFSGDSLLLLLSPSGDPLPLLFGCFGERRLLVRSGDLLGFFTPFLPRSEDFSSSEDEEEEEGGGLCCFSFRSGGPVK